MKDGITAKRLGWCYAFVHFAMEVACFYFLFSRMQESPYWFGVALLYDTLAFVPQSFLGAWLDNHPRTNFGLFGVVAIVGALLLPWDPAAFVLLTLGNALLHVCGAHATLCSAKGKLTPSSIFVAGGSFGVITGQLLGMANWSYAGIFPLVGMMMAGIVLFAIRRKYIPDGKTEGFAIHADIPVWLLVGLTFLTVVVRSYVGYAIPTAWNKTTVQTVLLFVCMGLGKGLGGVLADRFGARWTAAGSLLVALPFLLFGNAQMMISLVGVALFGMTMPLTLGILVSRFPDMPGLSFGITTVGLFLGSAPAFFLRPQGVLAQQIVVAVLTLGALAAFLICIRKEKKNELA